MDDVNVEIKHYCWYLGKINTAHPFWCNVLHEKVNVLKTCLRCKNHYTNPPTQKPTPKRTYRGVKK